MFQDNNFPVDLIQEYLRASNKLKKFDRVIFKKFAPNVAEVSNDFNRLAIKFEDASIFQYAGMCYLGAAKCEKCLGNLPTEIDFYLKSARAFVKANVEIEKLGLRSNNREYIEGALKSYDLALQKLDDNSVIKASVVREIKKIHPQYEGTSSFSSPAHHIYDLEVSANDCIKRKDYVSALDKLTDILENIIERKTESLYCMLLSKIELTRLLLLLILNLPPGRQSPSHIKLLENYSNIDIYDSSKDNNYDNEGATITEDESINVVASSVAMCSRNHNMNNWKSSESWRFRLPNTLQLACKNLVISWLEKDHESILGAIEEIVKFKSLKQEHRMLLEELWNLYRN